MVSRTKGCRSSNHPAIILAAFAGVALLGSASGQVNTSWNVSTGGLFNDPANWVGSVVPTGTASFNNAPSGIITFNAGTTTLGGFRFASDYGPNPTTPGIITLDLTGAAVETAVGSLSTDTLSVGGAAGQENDVRLTGSGTLKTRDIRIGWVDNASDNSLTVSGGAKILAHSGSSPSVAATILRIGNALASNNKITFGGTGTILASTETGSAGAWYMGANNTTATAAASGVGNVLTVNSGAIVSMKSAFYIGHTGAFGADTPNLIDLNGGELHQEAGTLRDVYLRDGILRVRNNGFWESTRLFLHEANSNGSVDFSTGKMWVHQLTADLPGTASIVFGDGSASPAELKLTRNSPGTSTGAAVWSFTDGALMKSNVVLTGSGTIAVSGGALTTTPGMKVRPDHYFSGSSIAGAKTIGTLRVEGSNWDNTGIDIELHTGNFPLTLAAVVPPAVFVPPVDKFEVSGAFTLGGTVTIDMTNYAAPQDQNYDLKVVSWGSSVGSTSSMPVSFVNGSPVPYEFRSDGLYLNLAMVAAGSTWNFNGSGSWSVASNWQGGVPNAADAVANFGTIITSAATVSLDAAQTVGKMAFSSPISYALSGATLTIDVNTGTAGLIDVTAGAHSITAPVVLSDNTTVSAAASTSLAMTGGITGAVTLTKSGDGLVTTGKVSVGSLSVSAGTLQLQSNGAASGVAEVTALSVSGTGRLDVTNNGAVINYTSPADPSAAVRASLATGYAAGAWNGQGIMSSAAGGTTGFGVGYAKASDLGVSVVFGSISVDSDTLVVRRTYNGDSNLDGKVNTVDFNYLAGGFGSGSPGWINGDYDYDSDVDSIDFNALAGNYGKMLPPAAPGLGSVVPEPASLSVLALAGLLVRRRR